MEAILFILFLATWAGLKMGEYSRIFPSFSWGIFGHMTCLDQSRTSENIWWIIIWIIYSEICLWTLSVPRSSQFSSSFMYALRKLFSSRNRYGPQTNIQAHICAKLMLLFNIYILIGSCLWSIRGQTHDWRHHLKVFKIRILIFLRIKIIFYVTGQKIRYKKGLPRHWTGTKSRKKHDKTVSFLRNSSEKNTLAVSVGSPGWPQPQVFQTIFSTPATFKGTSKLFGSQGCSDDKNWLDFSSIFLRFVDFAVQFCFRCEFSFHEKKLSSHVWQWCDFPWPIAILCYA